MAGEDFTIETKLKIAGVVATGNLDAGTLKFKVDTSALKKLVKDAAAAAASVKSKFDNIKLNKIKLEINQASLRQIESQIRGAIRDAVGKAKVVIDTSLGKGLQGDPFKSQRAAAAKAAESLKTMHELTKDVNQGLRSLVTTLGKFGGMGPTGGAGQVIQANAPGAGLPLPPGAKVVDISSIQKEIEGKKKLGDFTELLNQKERDGIKISQQMEAQFTKTEKARLQRLQQIGHELDELKRKEQQLVQQLSGAGAGVPLGGFGGGGGGRRGGGGVGGGAPAPGGFGGGGGGAGASSVQQLARAMEEVTASTGKASSEMDELEQLAFQVGRKAATFRGVAIAINTVVNSTEAAVKFVIQYSDSLLELNKVLQANKEVLQVVGDNLFDLAKSSGFAVDQTVGIATEFARAGLEGRGYGNVVELTEKALLGLQGTSLDAAQSTEIIIQTIQQLEGGARGLSKELVTTSKLFDILGRAEDITASKASDIQDAFKRSLASLAATGASMEELVSIVSVLQERTQRGGDVIGTALKTLASRISSSSSEASQALKSIGVATVDSEGKLRNIFDVLRETSVAFQGLSEAEQSNIAVKAAGIRQVEIFRAALLDFNRLQEVQNDISSSSGDAARKQKLEQEKLGNTIKRITISLQELVKTASEGVLGKFFVGAIDLADKLLGGLANLDKALGGMISSFGFGAILVGAFKTLIPLVRGVFKAFDMFLHSGKEANVTMNSLNQKVVTIGANINSGMTNGLQKTATVMIELNAQMEKFNQQQQLAAVRAQQLEKAREMAVREFGAKGQRPNDKQVNDRVNQILSRQDKETSRARNFGIMSMEHQGRGNELVAAVKSNPEQFTDAERKRILAMEKDITKSRGRIVTSFEAIGKSMGNLVKNPLVQGVGLSLLAGGLDAAAKSTEGFGSTLLKAGSSAAQFAGLGALFGPWGIAIGAVAGGVTSLVTELSKNKNTVEELGKSYAKLGLIQTKNGEIGVDAAQQVETAFENIQALKDFSLAKTNLAGKTGGPGGDAEAAKLAKQVEASAKSLIASLDRTSTAEEKRKQILESATGALKAQTGSKFKLDDATLKAGSKALREVTSNEFDAIIEALTAITPAGAKDKIQEKAKEFYDQAADALSTAELNKRKASIQQSQESFADELKSTLSKVSKLGFNVDSEFNSALQNLAKGINSEDVQNQIQSALSGAARGNGPRGTNGANLGLPQVQQLIDKATKIGTQAKDLGGTKAGNALVAVLEKLPEEISKAIIEAQDKQAKSTRQTQLDSQLRAFDSISTEVFTNAKQVVKSIGTPVDKLQLALRDFISNFSSEVIKLREATINATTPQKELASSLRKFAEVRLEASQQQRGLSGSDAVLEFRNAINELGGLERKIGQDAAGNTLPGFSPEDAGRTVKDAVQELSNGLLSAIEKIRKEGTVDPRAQRQALEQALPQKNIRDAIGEEAINTIIDNAKKLGSKLIELDSEVADEQIKVNRAKVDELKNFLSEEAKDLAINKQRREVLAENAKAALEELTGVRQLVAARNLEAAQAKAGIAESSNRIASLNRMIAAEKAILAVDKDNVAAKDKLVILQDEQVKESISLEEQLASERIANIKQTLSVAQEAIAVGQREADFQRSLISGRGELVDLLAVGEKQIDQFNRKLEQNSQAFRATQASLASEFAVVSATISDGTEKEARLSDIRKRGALAAIDAAKAEAQIISERRSAIQELVQEAMANQQEQANAQKSVIDATKALSDAYMSYREAVQGALLATTQYAIGLKMASVETVKITGGFTGIKDELTAVTSIFKDAEKTAREMGASEKTLVQLRRQSIDQQLSLFNQLLTQQSTLARTFFQSSAEDQASLFQGIQQAKSVADMLGGSFANFQKKGETAINDLGAQILALPQETRQQVVRSLETLSQVNGAKVGGFTPDQLLTAIETASLGTSKEGLDVDPLFEVQKRIADLTQQQARIATDQLVASQQSVDQSKQQLQEAQAAKDLAQIQLDRIKDEGTQLRGKIGELNADLRTVLLQQDSNQKNGFNMVTGIIGRTNDIIAGTLPDALSVKIAQAFRDVLSAGNVNVPGLTPPSTAQSFSTPTDRGTEMAQNLRQEGSNKALQQQIANQAGNAPAIVSQAFGNAQERDSNLPDSSSSKEANARLSDILSELQNINALTTTNNDVLTQIRDSSGNTLGTASATLAGGAGTAPEITVNINGEQRITVTGFEAGVTRIATALSETFGGFATEAEAREIANSVVDAIRLELQRLGILQRNQL